jgi:hypothetical protein
VPPDHDVGVGAEAGDVIGAADDDVLAGELVDQPGDLVGDGGPLLVGQGLRAWSCASVG